MITNDRDIQPENPAQEDGVNVERRASLRRLARFAAVTPPAVTLLLSASTKSAKAGPGSAVPSSRQFKEPVAIQQLK